MINNDGSYHLSRRDCRKIESHDPKRIIVAHPETAKKRGDDDFYAQFEVPDDLDW